MSCRHHGECLRRYEFAIRAGGVKAFHFGVGLGSNGSMASQRASGTGNAASMARHHGMSLQFCNTLLNLPLAPPHPPP
jgi:hypothetical protein